MFRKLILPLLLLLAACNKTNPAAPPAVLKAAPSAIALVIVLDKSGSMGAPVAGQTKMDFANIAAMKAIQLLAPADYAQIGAVDTEVHWMAGAALVPLNPANAAQLKSQIFDNTAGGGGIYTRTALAHAYQIISDPANPAAIRHIILFADAADTEQQEGCLRMAGEFAHHNPPVTLTVIGLGQPSDPDAAFQRALAKAGLGVCLQTDVALNLPRPIIQDVSALKAQVPK